MYTENDLVAAAKRENNKKRSYLLVNKLQGKHVPVSPCASLKMFSELAEIVKKEYSGERLLLVGFAETATAIGSALAAEIGSYYIQTTRENIGGVDYLYFSEQHSHASEQKLVKNDIDFIIGRIDRIVFVEDEVTTGNTILNIINIIEKSYPAKIGFSVASLINGMDEAHAGIYEQRGIRTHYLVKTCNSKYEKLAKKYESNGTYYSADISCPDVQVRSLTFNGRINARRLTDGAGYRKACECLSEQIMKIEGLNGCRRVLVLGTEEFMYPAMLAAEKLEKNGHEVKFHATTRSPITVSNDGDYPLHTRYELKSLYDAERTTYIYNMEKYDAVLIVTDAENVQESALNTLLNSAAKSGNGLIYTINWIE